jgi:hypothetical protein
MLAHHFHIITSRDDDGWCSKSQVWSTPHEQSRSTDIRSRWCQHWCWGLFYFLLLYCLLSWVSQKKWLMKIINICSYVSIVFCTFHIHTCNTCVNMNKLYTSPLGYVLFPFLMIVNKYRYLKYNGGAIAAHATCCHLTWHYSVEWPWWVGLGIYHGRC